MNNQESYDFGRTHKYNIETLELFKSGLWAAWMKDGKPKDAPGELGKHVWIVIAGVLERCTQAIKEEEDNYRNILKKRALSKEIG